VAARKAVMTASAAVRRWSTWVRRSSKRS
jgi:hypothetical protein